MAGRLDSSREEVGTTELVVDAAVGEANKECNDKVHLHISINYECTNSHQPLSQLALT